MKKSFEKKNKWFHFFTQIQELFCIVKMGACKYNHMAYLILLQARHHVNICITTQHIRDLVKEIKELCWQTSAPTCKKVFFFKMQHNYVPMQHNLSRLLT